MITFLTIKRSVSFAWQKMERFYFGTSIITFAHRIKERTKAKKFDFHKNLKVRSFQASYKVDITKNILNKLVVKCRY